MKKLLCAVPLILLYASLTACVVVPVHPHFHYYH
jgi:hypothetical protein